MKWFHDKSICTAFTCFVYVLMMWSDCLWSLGAVQIFISAEELKIEFYSIIRQSEQFGAISCVDFDHAPMVIHMIQRFVIKGCPGISFGVGLDRSRVRLY